MSREYLFRACCIKRASHHQLHLEVLKAGRGVKSFTMNKRESFSCALSGSCRHGEARIMQTRSMRHPMWWIWIVYLVFGGQSWARWGRGRGWRGWEGENKNEKSWQFSWPFWANCWRNGLEFPTGCWVRVLFQYKVWPLFNFIFGLS